MRQIKFRGIDCAGKWHKGDLVTRGEETYIKPNINEFKVNPSSIGQFTGMEDVLGVEIWEGDIIEAAYIGADMTKKTKRVTVYYEERNAAFCLKKEDGKAGGLLFTTEQVAFLRVVGNIYQGQEL